MADQRITQLAQLFEADVAATDVLPIVDISTSQTKKVTAKDLFEAGATLADNGSIDLGRLNQSSTTKIGTTALADAAITAIKISNNSSIVYDSVAPLTNNFIGRGYVNSSTKSLQVWDGSAFQTISTGVLDGAVTEAKIASGAVTDIKIQASGLSTSSIANGAITNAKLSLSDGGIDAAKLVPNSITSTQLAVDSVATSRIQDGAVTNAKLSLSDNGIDAAKLVSGSITSLQLAASGVVTSNIQDEAVTTAKLADGSVTSAKLGTGAVTSAAIASGNVDTTEIADNAVTYGKIQQTSATDVILGRSAAGAGDVEEIACTAAGRALLDDADAAAQRSTLGLGTLATQNGTFTGTHSGTSSGTNTGDQTITLTGDVTGTGTGTFAATIANDAVTNAKIAADAVTTTEVANDAITGAKLADDSATIVSGNAPSGNGDFEGQQWINSNTGLGYFWTGSVWVQLSALQTITFNDSTPLNFAVTKPDNYSATVTATLDNQNANLVLAGPSSGAATTPSFRALTSGDLPVATVSSIGAIQPGTGLSVTGGGVLNHSNTVAAGSYARVTVDAQGHVTAGGSLVADDVPSLDASKITSGTFAGSLFGTNSIVGSKLANESTVRFGGAGSTAGIVNFPVAEFKGQYFWDESNSDLWLWSGSAWVPVTITSGELVFAGTYDASLNLVDSKTTAGDSIGLTVGGALPGASTANNRYYLVVSEPGTGTGNAPSSSLEPPDMILSTGTAWELVNLSETLTGQTALNVSFTPGGGIASTNVQTALLELDTEKVSRAGDIITGQLKVGSAGSLVFEGTTSDAYQTAFAVVDPTASRTITFPDATGTVVLSGTIVNADINASAAIVDTKLATISTANKVSLSALDIDGASDIGTALTDADTFIVDEDGAGVNRKSAVTRIYEYTFGKVSGDITIASNGTAAIGSGVIVDADVNASAAIAFSKLANVSATDRLLGRSSAGAGAIEEITCTAAGRALIDDADAAAQRTTLGLGTIATLAAPSGTVVGTTDTQTLTNKTLTDPAIVGTILEDVYTITDGADFEVDPGNGSVQLITLGAARTPKATNFAAGESVTLMVDDGSDYTLTWTDSTWGSGGVVWVGGSAPALATSGYTVLQFWKVGSQIYGARVGDVA